MRGKEEKQNKKKTKQQQKKHKPQTPPKQTKKTPHTKTPTQDWLLQQNTSISNHNDDTKVRRVPEEHSEASLESILKHGKILNYRMSQGCILSRFQSST